MSVRARSWSKRSPSVSVGPTSRSSKANMAGRHRERRAWCWDMKSLGRVIDPGPSSSFKKGDLVSGIVRRPDPVPCPNCAVGEWDMCRNGQYTERGIKEIHGFMSERWRIEPEYAIKVDPSLGILGVLLEPTTVIIKALEQVLAVGQRSFWEPQDRAGDRCGSDRSSGGCRSESVGNRGPCPGSRQNRAEAGTRARPRCDVSLRERSGSWIRAGRHRRMYRGRVGDRRIDPEDRSGRGRLPHGRRNRRRSPPGPRPTWRRQRS